MVPVAVVVGVVTLRPRLLNAPLWRATVTPLASIIGSGFLVCGPILAHVAGNWAWAAMLALALAAYVIGAAIRSNIAVVEPLLEGQPPRAVLLLERSSGLALALAYFVSVAYYLNLFVSFGLRAVEIVDPETTRWLASGVIGVLGVVGACGGLLALEGVETRTVGLKLAIIAALLVALAYASAAAVASGDFQLSTGLRGEDHGVEVLLGLLILVQGFETSRYLGEHYDRQTRVKTMRNAQLLSAAIYVAFIFLVTPFFSGDLPAVGGETEIIDMLQPLGAIAAPMIIVAALASQLSAAVADMNGASGLLSSVEPKRLPMTTGYLVTAGVAIGITWAANIFEIIVYASKAFALYYALQSMLAFWTALRIAKPRRWRAAAVAAVAGVLSLLVLLLGESVE